ncbi:hypothetical protein ANO11243_064200 [Dothideomycetidae sp. 11243]|nr:hypothetical protein ANO11243_064200 [fungal sp. No.11243]
MASYKQLLGFSAVASYGINHYATQLAIKQSFFLTALVVFLSLAFPKILYKAFIFPNFISPIRHLPGPSNPHWLFGHGLKIIRDPTGVPMREWNNEVPNEGLIRYTSFLNSERLLVTGPKALAEVLVTKNYDFVKPNQVRAGLGRIAGEGILLAEGDEHKRQRKFLAPAFAFRHIKDLYPVFWQKSVEMVNRIGNDISHRPADWHKEANVLEFGTYTSRTTLDIIGLAGMGQDFGAIENPSNTLAQHYSTIFKPPPYLRYLQILALLFPPWVMRNIPIKRNQQINEARAYIRELCQTLIDAKRVDMSEKRPGYDILSVALESGGFTDENLIDQMMTFLIAGHETTSTGLIWAIYLLANHPQYQTRLREEIHANLASPRSADGKVVNSTQIDSLPYLTAVINEVLRLWAPVTMTMRVANKDSSIQNVPVPKGTLLIMSPWATNTSYELWGDDAMQFNPDRWMKDASSGKGGAESNYSFLTFLHGPRSCIGERFSRSEFACLLAACVGRFEWEMETPGVEPRLGGMVTPRPKDGLWVRVKEQHDW